MNLRRSLLLSLALGCGLGAAGRPKDLGEPQRREVQMRSVSFSPSELHLAIGDTVVWKNIDVVRHNAVRPGVFDTGELRSGESHTWVPTDTGTIAYRCTIHARMRGKLVVRARSPDPGDAAQHVGKK